MKSDELYYKLKDRIDALEKDISTIVVGSNDNRCSIFRILSDIDKRIDKLESISSSFDAITMNSKIDYIRYEVNRINKNECTKYNDLKSDLAETIKRIEELEDEGECVEKKEYPSVGDSYNGGIVFYVSNDPMDGSAKSLKVGSTLKGTKGKHGLIVSPEDLSDGIAWSSEYSVTDAQSDSDGAVNTIKILDNMKNNYNAACLCHTYRKTHTTNWYLPSKDELNLLYQSKLIDSSNRYWSSTESSASSERYAWLQHFNYGYQPVWSNYLKRYCFGVRAVRRF